MGSPPSHVDRKAAWSIFLAVFAIATSVSFIFAILPAIGRSLGLSEIQLGLVVAPAALVFVLTGPLWGRLNVRFGQKQTIILALIAAAVSTIAFGLVIVLRLGNGLSTTATFLGLVAGRMGLSLFAAAVLPTAQAYIADTTAHEHRTAALAQMGAGFALGLVAAPGIAGATASLGPFIPFLVIAMILAIATLVAMWGLARTEKLVAAHHHAGERTKFSRIWSLLFIIMLFYTAYAILLQVTGFRIQDQFDLPPEAAAREAGIALMVTAAGLVFTQLALARADLATRWTGRVLLAGSVVALAAMGILASSVSFPVQLVGMALFGCGLGLGLPSVLGLMTLIAEVAGDQGRVGGLSGSAQGLGLVFGPLVGAATYKLDGSAPYIVGIVLLAMVCGLRLFAARTTSASHQ